MTNAKISFDDIPWEHPQQGLQQKTIQDGDKTMRLVRFSEEFIEEEWCTKGHQGFVLSGTMTVDFNGTIVAYKKGDGLWIASGKEHQHKVIMAKGQAVELILFETKKF